MATTIQPTIGAPAPTHVHRTAIGRVLAHPNLLSAGAYALIALGADWPIWPGDPSRLPYCDCNDVVQTLWFLRYVPFALSHGQNLFATHLMQWPAGVDLAQNTTIWLLGLLTAPLTVLAGPIASLNLLRFLAFFLSALSMYLVLRRFFRFAPACFVGGLLYGYSPYLVAQGTLHVDLIFVPLPPVIFLLVYELVVRQRGSAWRTGALLGVTCVAQFFISAEILASTSVVLVVALVVLGLTCARQVRSHLRHALIGGLIAAGVLGVATAYPIWMMRHGPDHYLGPAQGYHNVFNADLLSAIIPTSFQRVAPSAWKALGDAFVSHNIHENDAFVGVPILVLAAYVVARYWRRLWPVYLAIVMLGVYVLELGSHLVVDTHRIAIPIQMPFAKLEHLPIVANIEAVRFALYVILLVAVIVAFGIDSYAADVRRRRATTPHPWRSWRVSTGRLLGAGLVAVALVSLIPNWPYASRPVSFYRNVPANELTVIPKGAVVLSYPFASPESPNAMYWQVETDFRFKILGGYALIYGGASRASEYPHVLEPFQIEAIFQQSYLGRLSPRLAPITATRATITPHYALLLREFLRRHGVDAIAVEQRRRGSRGIDDLVDLALGRASFTEPDVRVWTHVKERLGLPWTSGRLL